MTTTEIEPPRREDTFQASDIARDVQTRLEAAAASARAIREAFASWYSAEGKSAKCQAHARTLPVDRHATFRLFAQTGQQQLVFESCPICHGSGMEGWLHRQGVPVDLVDATFASYKPRCDFQAKLLRVGQRLASVRRGFIAVAGPVGTGKSHIGVAILRALGRGRFIKQRQLLEAIRRRYDDRRAADVLAACQSLPFLVLDEFTTSTANDEAGAVASVIDTRLENDLPTYLTSNLSLERLKSAMGDRLVDRFRQRGVFIPVAGESYRLAKRATREEEA